MGAFNIVLLPFEKLAISMQNIANIANELPKLCWEHQVPLILVTPFKTRATAN